MAEGDEYGHIRKVPAPKTKSERVILRHLELEHEYQKMKLDKENAKCKSDERLQKEKRDSEERMQREERELEILKFQMR